MVLLHESLAGIRLVKSLCREPFEEKRFAEFQQYNGRRRPQGPQSAWLIVAPLMESMGAVGIMAAFVYAYFAHMPLSNFVTLIGSLLLLYTPVKKLSKVHVSIQKALGATTKIFELLDVAALHQGCA